MDSRPTRRQRRRPAGRAANAELLEPRRLLAAAGLVAAFSFDEAGGTVAADSSGLANNGVLTNATWSTSGKFDDALSFNGTNSWMTVADSASLRLASAVTLEAWVRPASLAGWETVAMKERPGGLCYALYSSDNTNKPPAGYVNRGNDVSAAGTAALPLNAWSHLATSYNGSTLKMYVNGVLVRSRALTGAITTSTGALRIGGNSPWGEYFSGLIDEVRVYNRALSDAEVLSDMNTRVGPATDTTPPTVTAQTPAPGATGVPLGAAITATFSESVQPTTPALTLTAANGTVVNTTLGYSDPSHTASFAPAGPLAATTTYTATLSGAKDLAGNALAAPVTWTFTTATPDTTPPTLTAQAPAPGATGVAVGSTVAATLGEAIQPGTLSFTLTDAANNAVSAGFSYDPTSRVATLTPAAPLASNAVYTATASGAKDPAGNVMSPAAWSFTTLADTTAPTVTAETPAPGATGVPVGAAVTVTFSESIRPGTLSFVVRDAKANLVATTGVSYNDATRTATYTPSAPLAQGMTYTAVIADARDLAGNAMAEHLTWSFVTAAPGTGPFSLWTSADAPVVATDNDARATEVGVKFRTDVAGYVTAVRFYKGATNGGTHVGHLWTGSGALLGTATFTNETAAGWQQVNFAQPIAVAANTTYVASYFAPQGHYAEDDNYFAAKSVDSAPLHALKAGVDGFNGVYAVSASPVFPTSNYQSANYWIDVSFTTAAPLGPSVTAQSPAPGATNAAVNGAITATFNTSVLPGSIQFTVMDAANHPVAGAVTYNEPTHTATFTPALPLAASTTYTASVTAQDASGTPMGSPATWSFTTAAPAADPALVGQWSAVAGWPLVAINQILLHDGRILMWDGGPDCIGWSSARVWDPTTNAFTAVPVPNAADDNDIFCSANSVLADGRVLVTGGHDCTGVNTGIKSVNIFDPATNQWTRLPSMAYARWYPTSTVLSDGKVLVTSGSDHTNSSYVPVPELYDPVTGTMTQLTAASQTIPNYPFMFVLPDGRVIEAGSDEAKIPTKVLDLATQTWTVVDPNAVDGSSAVMYRPGMIMKAGASCPEEGVVAGTPSAATAYVLDMTQPSPHWQQTQSMANARTWLDLTMLPDGNVLATGGSRDLLGADPSRAVLPAEMWNPTTLAWTTLASMQTPRMYHSTALLLPDGRVVVAGGGHNYVNNNDFFNAEVYSPAYLFKGPRPTITSSPGTVEYGSTFAVQTPDAANIASVSLIRAGAVTHSIDMDQRYVPLNFSQGAGGLNVQAPANANLAPPGYYMLFIVDANGVPSVAPFVRFPAAYEDGQPPSAPGTLTATPAGIGTASLSWGAATDNLGVAKYDVYRSTVPGFTPAAANRVAQVAGLTYTDAGLPAGTYYYAVAAEDAAGNVGPASNRASVSVAGDTTAPTVSLDSPIDGSTISGPVTLSATAADDVGVAGVQFLLDGAALGAEDASAPYSAAWNSAAVSNGPHMLAARARDAAGNVTTSAVANVTVSNAVVSPNLVAAYQFDEGAGTSVGDSSGKGNNGTISGGAAWTAAGRSGSALAFNGASGMVTIADSNSLDLTAGMTLEAWVKPAAIAPDWSTVILKERTGGLAYSLYAYAGAGRPPAAYINRGSDYGATGAAALPLNAWSFLTGTYDGANVRLYLNGTLVATRAISGGITTSNSPLRIGGNSVWGEWFNGVIDEVRIYNTALTAAQIQSDMSLVAPPAQTYAISGTVSPAAGGAGATLTLTGAAAANATADASGNYNFGGLVDGTYTVTPSFNGYTYTPASRTVTVSGGNLAGVSFTASPAPVTGSNIQLVQRAVNGNESGTASMSVSLANVTAGDFLIITGTAARPNNALTIADSAGNTFAAAAGPIVDPAQDVTSYIWYVPVAKGGPDTFTITPSVTSALEIHVSEWSGMSATASVDQVSFATGSGTAISSGSRVTTAAGELVFGYAWVLHSASAGAGFASLSLVNGDLDEYQIQTAAGTAAATFNHSSAGAWLALMVTFKPA